MFCKCVSSKSYSILSSILIKFGNNLVGWAESSYCKKRNGQFTVSCKRALLSQKFKMKVSEAWIFLIICFHFSNTPYFYAEYSTRCIQSNITFSHENKTRCTMQRSDWEFTKPKDFSMVTEYDLVCERKYLVQGKEILSTSLVLFQ